MGAAVAVRRLPGGRQEILIAGGGGGQGLDLNAPPEPQSMTVERLDPVTLNVRFGENLPEQGAIRTVRAVDKTNDQALPWSSSAMVVVHEMDGSEKITAGARLFGQTDAYLADTLTRQPKK